MTSAPEPGDRMATVNVGDASQTLMSPSFLKSAVLIVLGSLAAQIMTSYLRQNVYDVQVQGGDAIYSAVAAFLAVLVLPGKYGRPLALGSAATSFRVLLRDFNVV